LPGHFSQILGDSAEEDFYALALDIGYNVIRRRNLSPGIDFIAEFRGTVFENAVLLKPPFAPDGVVAFSVKAGEVSSGDVDQLNDYVSECRRSTDTTLQRVTGAILVAGTLKTAGQINSIKTAGVFCWDARRLIFYSIKAKKVAAHSDLGQVTEHALTSPLNGTFIFTIHDMQPNNVDATADVFVDDHNISIQGDHLSSMLTSIHQLAVLPTVQSMHRQVKLKLSVHALGPIMRSVVEQAYETYRRQPPSSLLLHPVTELELQSYATGSWTAIFRV
jgi:hypothetical protein